MSAKKFYYVLMGILFLSISATAASVYVGITLMKKSSDKLVQTKLDNIGYDSEEQTYLQARKVLEKYKPLDDTLQKILPKQKDQALAVRELYKIGDETGISVDNVQFPNSTLGQTKTSTSSGTTGSTTPSTITQAKAVDGMPGVLGIDINVILQSKNNSSISYDSMIKFLQKVELNRRYMQVKNITIYKDTENGGITFQLTLTIFVKP